MCKECETCVHKSDFKAVECGTCEVSYYDGVQQGLPSNYKTRPKTNADRIRAMSDWELAEFMADRNVNEYTVWLLNADHGLTATQIEALKCNMLHDLMRWLQQPAEGE